MDINFPLILLLLVSTGALIWLADIIWFRKQRPDAAKEPALVENARQLTPILALVFFFRSFLFEPFQIPSASMVPTLLIGDFILVNKYTYGIRLPVWRKKVMDIGDPQRGDIMVFFPPHKDQYFIKRVIGVPGDHIVYKDKQLTVNGEVVDGRLLAALPVGRPTHELLEERHGSTAYLTQRVYAAPPKNLELVVPEGEYFMMGDNRDRSSDSREWGTVPEARIVGRAVAIWMHKEPGWHLPGFDRVGGLD